MNNSISKIELNNIDNFGTKNKQNVPNSTYWLTSAYNTQKDSVELGEVQKILITPKEARKTNNLKIIGLSIAGATVLTAAAIFFVLKGGPKGLAKGLEKLKNHYEKQFLESKLNTGAAPNNFYLYLAKLFGHAASKAETVNNFTSFKDTLFKRIMNVTKVTGKIHDKITRLFEKIGRQAVVNAYSSTAGKLNETTALTESIEKKILSGSSYEIIDIGGIKLTKAQWLTEIKKLNGDIGEIYEAHFNGKALQGRYYKMKNIALKLYEKFKDMKIFKTSGTVTEFMAESAIAEEKSMLQKSVINYRRKLSYSVSDLAEMSQGTIMDILKLLGYKDTQNIKKLAEIRANLQKYINTSAKDETLKSQLLQDISNFRKEIETAIKNKTIKPEKADNLLEKIDEFKAGIEDFQQGKVQKILNIYKKLLTEDEYELVAKSYSDGIHSLDKSIKTETEDFMSKLRDLTLGSAPTDILTLLGSVSVFGYHLGKSDDKAQKQSIALKYGIPALGGIGVSLFCNAKLFAGSKSLLAGSISTWVLNRIGEFADKKLKQHNSK